MLLAKALEHLRPDLASRIPAGPARAARRRVRRVAGAALEAAERAARSDNRGLGGAAARGGAGPRPSRTRRAGPACWARGGGLVSGGLAAVGWSSARGGSTAAARAMLAHLARPARGVVPGAVRALGAIAALTAAVGAAPGRHRAAGCAEQARTPGRTARRPFAAIALGLALILWPRAVLALAGRAARTGGRRRVARPRAAARAQRAAHQTPGRDAPAGWRRR